MKKMKRITMKKKIIAGIILLVGILVIVFVLRARKRTPERSEQGSVLAVEVTRGTIESGVSGTGTLAYGNTTSILVPADLQIDEVLISAGETVSAGTLLATVDQASLAVCLSEIYEAISDVDSTISTEKSKSESAAITAQVGGRVKEIYAQVDDSVTEVMEENGALMLLSIDGYMALDLENARVSVGDTVKVTDGDTTVEGTVSSLEGETAVILFSDSKFAVGANLSVTDSDGTEFGTADAYVHAPLKVVGTSGTISAVKVSEGSSVSASSTVFTLKETSRTAEYQQAVKDREELEELLTMLIAVQKNGGITAAQDGVIESINTQGSAVDNSSVSNGSTLAVAKENKEAVGAELASESGEVLDTLNLASGSVEVTDADIVADITQGKASTGTGGFVTMSSSSMTLSGTKDTAAFTASEKPVLEAPAGLTGGERVINGTTTHMEYADKEDASEWKECTDKTTAVSAGTWYVRYKETDANAASPAVKVEVLEKVADTSNGTEDGPNTEGVDNRTNENQSPADKDNTSGNTNKTGSGTGSGDTDKNDSPQKKSGSGAADTNVSGSGSSAASSSMTSENSSGVETTELFVLADGETMTVTMTVDELDILSMETGLEAVVSVDAVENKTFTGTITSVSGQTSGSGGVAQYLVEITFEKTEQMLEGMSASVEVILEKAENVLVIPISAVTDRGRSSVVYKGEDAGVLSDETEIETGLSDEIYVEVTSGLSEGDTIYYQMAGSQDSGSGQKGGFGDFNGKGMMNDGMPGGMDGDRSGKPGGDGSFDGGGGNGGPSGNSGFGGGEKNGRQ